jgi:predicted ATP-dependent serine protease
MSSFKRAVKPAAVSVVSTGQDAPEVSSSSVRDVPITGVKPWVSTGLGIVSTGNKQLDDLVGGGSALGTLTLIESDGFSNYGETLLLYNLAEGASHQHPFLLIAEDSVEAERLISALPCNQTVGSAGANDVAPVVSVTGEDSNNSNKLTIAWQYSKYLKPTGA